MKIETPDQVVTFTYTKKEAWTATARYIDTAGNQITIDGAPVENTTVSVTDADSYVFFAKAIPGYRAQNAALTAIRDEATVTFVYEAIANPAYTIKYVDMDTDKEVHPQDTRNDVPRGQLVTVPKSAWPDVDGYEAVSATSGYASENLVVYVYYKATVRSYTVHYYLQPTTTKVAPDESGQAQVGTNLKTVVDPLVKTIPGYTVVDADYDNFVITADGSNEFIVYYTQNQYTLTINYVYADDIPDTTLAGKKAHESHVETLTYNATYSVESPSISGYTPDVTTVSGTMLEDNVTVTVTYSANANTPYVIQHFKQNPDGSYPADPSDTDPMTGTTGQTVTTEGQVRMYEGFTYAPDAVGTVTSGTITGDGTLTLKLYYTRNEHTVTYEYEGTVPAGAGLLPEATHYKYGKLVSIAPAPTTPAGYTFSGWSIEEAFNMPDEDVVIKGSFKANGDTPYTVEYYVQDIEDDDYTQESTTTEKGETGSEAIIVPKQRDGFEINEEKSLLKDKIAGNGSTVLKVYYDRIKYKVEYNYSGFVPADASQKPLTVSYKFGKSVEVAPPATAAGYTFSGWTTEDVTVTNGTFDVPANDVTFTGSFTAQSGIAYKVEHYKQTLNGTYPTTPSETENLTGTTGETVNAEPKSYPGFTYDPSAKGTVTEGTIKGDGSLTLKLYYTRDEFKVTYAYSKTAPEGAAAAPAEATYKYEEPVNVAAQPELDGYTFNGWTTADVPVVEGAFTMPAKNVAFTGYFTANTNTPYTVIHYLETLDDGVFAQEDMDTKYGTTGEEATATPNSYIGFTYDPDVEGTVTEGIIKGDGSLVLKLYYTRNTYDVSYSYTGTVPAGAGDVPATKPYKFGETVNVEPAPATPDGYTFNGWSQQNATFTMPANDVVITGSFTANGDTKYTVEYYYQNIENDDYTKNDDETEELTGQTDTEATAPTPDKTGFIVNSTKSKLTGNIAGDGSLVLSVYYDRVVSTVYYNYDNPPAGAPILPAAVEYKYGATVTLAPDATLTGYTFTGWETNDAAVQPNRTFIMPETDVQITGGFTINSYTYKVVYYYDMQEGNTETGPATPYNETVTVTPNKSTAWNNTNYVLDYMEPADGSLKITADEASNVIKVYYAKDTKGGGDNGQSPDEIPDYAQIVLTYISANPTTGKVYPNHETFSFEHANGVVLETMEAVPGTVNKVLPIPTAEDGFAFDYWTDGTNKEFVKSPQMFTIGYNADTTFTAYFDADEKGGGEDGKDPDGTPDKYQTFFYYASAGNGTVEGKLFEKYENVGGAKPEASPKAEVTVKADTGYAFDYWTDDNGTKYWSLEEVRTVKTSADTTFTAYFDADEKGGGEDGKDPDGTPDKYQTFFYYTSAGNGTVEGKLFEKYENVGGGKPEASPKAEVTVKADTGYAFDYWTDNDGTKYWSLEELREVKTSTDTTFTAYFDVDEKGGGDDGEDPDGTPDKYQTVFNYTSAGNGTVEGKLVEKYENIGGGKPEASPKAEVTVKADTGYAFDYWTDNDGTKYWSLEELREVKTSTDTTFTAYFDVDEKGGGDDGEDPDGTPDKYQTVFNYTSAGNGTVEGKLVEKYENIGGGKPEASPKAKVTVKADTGYAFDYWTDNDGTKYWTLDEIRAVKTSTDTTFTAHFDVDETGGGDDGEDPDDIPDKYQVKVTYDVVNGTWTEGGNAQKSERLTLLDENGKWSETGSAKANLPGTTPFEGFVNGTWNPADTTVTKESNHSFICTFVIRTDLTYTVRYLENYTAREVAGTKTVEGQTFGTTVTETAPAIGGYSLLSPSTQSIEITTGENVITFYYQ
ncbi:InlB B-repeat-containing protein, partial [Gemmiger formicilis]|uniref:InlB B-repeat-containing protein n=1 Tax=Gemmiger formicilis TaxID=745368 RepID=UPI0031F69572